MANENFLNKMYEHVSTKEGGYNGDINSFKAKMDSNDNFRMVLYEDISKVGKEGGYTDDYETFKSKVISNKQPEQQQQTDSLSGYDILPDTTIISDRPAEVAKAKDVENKSLTDKENLFRNAQALLDSQDKTLTPTLGKNIIDAMNLYKNYKGAFSENAEALRSQLLRKWNSLGLSDYDMETLSLDENGVPKAKKKEATRQLGEDVFTTSAFDEGSVVAGVGGVLGLPTRILGKITGNGELSDEDTGILKDAILSNREFWMESINNDPGALAFLKNAGLKGGLLTSEILLQFMQDPTSPFIIANMLKKVPSIANTLSKINPSGKSQAVRTAEKMLLGNSEISATRDQLERVIVNSSPLPTSEEARSLNKVFNLGETAKDEVRLSDSKVSRPIAEGVSGKRPMQGTVAINELVNDASNYDDIIDIASEIKMIPETTKGIPSLNVAREEANKILEVVSELKDKLKTARLDLSQKTLDVANANKTARIKDLELKISDLSKRQDLATIRQRIEDGKAVSDESINILKETKRELADYKKSLANELEEMGLEKSKISLRKREASIKGNKFLVKKKTKEALGKDTEIFNKKVENFESQTRKGLEAGVEVADDALTASKANVADIAKEAKDQAKSIKLDNMISSSEKAKEKIAFLENNEISDLKQKIQNLKTGEDLAKTEAKLSIINKIDALGKNMTMAEAKKFSEELKSYLRDNNYWDGMKKGEMPSLDNIAEVSAKITDKVKAKGVEIYGEEFSNVWKEYADEYASRHKALGLLGGNSLKGKPIETISKKIMEKIEGVAKKTGNITADTADARELREALKAYDDAFKTTYLKDIEKAMDVKSLFKVENGRMVLDIKASNRTGAVNRVIDLTKNTLRSALANTVSILDNIPGASEQVPNLIKNVMTVSEGSKDAVRALRAQEHIASTIKKVYALGYRPFTKGVKGQIGEVLIRQILKSYKMTYNGTLSPEEYDFIAQEVGGGKELAKLISGADQEPIEDDKSLLDTAKEGFETVKKGVETASDAVGLVKKFSEGTKEVSEDINAKIQEGRDNVNEGLSYLKSASKDEIGNVADNFVKIKKDAESKGVLKSLNDMGVKTIGKIGFEKANPAIVSLAKLISGNIIDENSFTITSLQREDNPKSKHYDGNAFDIRGVSSDGKNKFDDRVKLRKIRGGRKNGKRVKEKWEPEDEETKSIIDSTVQKLMDLPFVKNANFEYEDPDTLGSGFAPHFHVEIDDVGLMEADVSLVAEILGKKLKVKATRDNFGGDTKIKGYSLE